MTHDDASLADRFEQFKRDRKYLKNVSPATLAGYDWAWKTFASVLTGNSVSKGDVVAHIAALREQGMTPVTLNTYIRTLNTFCHWLHDEDYADAQIRIPRLKEDRKVIQTFSAAQVQALVTYRPKTMRDRRIQLVSSSILDTGLRIDEALSLERRDVDLTGMTLKVHGKGAKERVVPFTLSLRKLLFRHIERHKPKHGDLVFYAGPKCEKIVQRNALRDFKVLCTKAGITGPRCSFHTLRHTFGKAYIASGGDVFRLQKILGHEKLEMTRRYVELDISALQEVHEQFSAFARSEK